MANTKQQTDYAIFALLEKNDPIQGNSRRSRRRRGAAKNEEQKPSDKRNKRIKDKKQLKTTTVGWLGRKFI